MDNKITVELTAEELHMIKLALATRTCYLEDAGRDDEADNYDELRSKIVNVLKAQED